MGKLAKLSPKSCGFFGAKIKKAARANIVAAKIAAAESTNIQIAAKSVTELPNPLSPTPPPKSTNNPPSPTAHSRKSRNLTVSYMQITAKSTHSRFPRRPFLRRQESHFNMRQRRVESAANTQITTEIAMCCSTIANNHALN